jgi:hypothetical protein
MLGCVASSRSDIVFRTAVSALAESVTRRDADTLDRREIERLAAPLLAFLPAEASRTAA